MTYRKPSSRKRDGRHSSRSDRKRLSERRLRVEPLESRRLLAALTVNSLADNLTSGDGLVTLREAVLAANADSTTDLGQQGSGSDTIEFTGPAAGGVIELSMGQIQLNQPLEIDGGQGVVIVGSGPLGTTVGDSRIFQISGAAGDVSLNRLTLTGGQAASGGAILNGADLIITNSTISGNTSLYGDGGGVLNERGHLTIINSTVSGNSADDDGGGIANFEGTLVVQSSTISGNSASSGGGVHHFVSPNDPTASASVDVVNSTFSGNTVTFTGGAIAGSPGISVTQSTITDNYAGDGIGGINADHPVLSGSLIAGNRSGDGGTNLPSDIGLAVDVSSSFNLVGDSGSAGGLTDGVDGNVVGVTDPVSFDIATVLLPLANNGGPTATHALVGGGPAIDASDPNLDPMITTDQRGIQRVINGRSDIGAFEYGGSSTAGDVVFAIQAQGVTSVFEGNTGVTEIPFLVTRSHTETNVSVQVILSGPLTNADATLSDQFVSFAANGPASQVIYVQVQGDTTVEPDEPFSVVLSNPMGGTLSTLFQATATILSDDANLIVTTLQDESDSGLGQGTGDSLREVLEIARNSNQANIIGFDPSLTQDGPASIALQLGTLLVESSVRIFGPENHSITIDGLNQTSLVEVDDFNFSTDSTVILQDLRFTNSLGPAIQNREDLRVIGATITGNVSENSPGAGILNEDGASLRLSDSVVTDNVSESYGGGGIFNAPLAFAMIERSLIANNQATQGGGINNDSGTLQIQDTTISGNTADFGGGIFSSNGNLGITASTLSENHSFDGAGGVHIQGRSASIDRSTISGNTSDYGAGGIYANAPTTIFHSTIAFNTSRNRAGIEVGLGASDVRLENTIVVGNQTAQSSESGDVGGSLDPASSFNLIGSPFGSGLSNGVNGNIVGTLGSNGFSAPIDAATVLEPLTNNGGPTFTHALLPGSLAVDAGDPSETLNSAVDQRDYQRPIGERPDIGSVEFAAAGLPSFTIELIGSSDIFEGNDGVTPVQFRVTRSDTVLASSVDLRLGGEISATDVSLANSTVSFPVGGLPSQLITVNVVGDTLLEQDERLTVSLANPVGANLSTLFQATATILSDDANLIVTTLQDELDGGLGLGTGDSLRELLYIARNSNQANIIGFDPSLTQNGPVSIALQSGTLRVESSVRIFGPENHSITIDGLNQTSLVEVNDFDPSTDSPVILQDVRFTNSLGPAIQNYEDLHVIGATITGNVSENSPGAGILNQSRASLRLSDSIVTENVSENDGGGGIFNAPLAFAMIERSLIANNQATQGGGINNDSGTLQIQDTTISGNSADEEGGGVFSANGKLDVTASTLSENHSVWTAGGLYIQGSSASINRSTVSSNTSVIGVGGIFTDTPTTIRHSTVAFNKNENYGSVAGIDASFGWESVFLQDTIVVGNQAGGPDNIDDVEGRLHPGSSFNLIGTPFSGGLDDGVDGNIVGLIQNGFIDVIDAASVLEPLANNGGPTFTHALVSGSLAVDAGDPSETSNSAADQRGYERLTGQIPDMGSVELAASGLPSFSIELIGDSEVIEGNGGVTPVQFRVTRSDTASASSVELRLSGDISATDTTLANSTVSFTADGLPSQVITVDVVGDTSLEQDERLKVSLANPVGGTLSTLSQATAVVLNDDANLWVTTLQDEDDGGLGLGTGDSLREILQAANENPDLDVIGFDSALTINGPASIIVQGDRLQIETSLRIFGPGRELLVIDGDNTSQLLAVQTFTGDPITARIHDLTFTRSLGTAVYNSENLILMGVEISESVSEGVGGGISSFGPLFISDSVIRDNEASSLGGGGGIYISPVGEVVIDRTTISGNLSGNGGGIRIFGSFGSGTVFITNSTIRQNESRTGGGGIALTQSNLVIENSTFQGNTATFSGGAIESDNSTLSLLRSTVSGNTSTSSNGGGIYTSGSTTISDSTITDNRGGGLIVSQFNAFGTTSVQNSIIAGNFDTFSTSIPLDVVGQLVPSSSFNLIGDPSTSGGLINSINGNIIGDPDSGAIDIATVLAPLADNGGPTLTHAPLPGSPAINMGYSTEQFDQRGEPFDRNFGGGVDIGAIEFRDFDRGDAPESYREAIHQAFGPRLGSQRDTETDGISSPQAGGDDASGVDDEDGVLFGAIVAGAQSGINLDLQYTDDQDVDIQGQDFPKVDAWIDFNNNGSWDDPGEKILDSIALRLGLQTLNYDVPSNAIAGVTFARVRVSTEGGLSPGDTATDGEVEDYAVTIGATEGVVIAAINGGRVTRSEITSIEVTFDSDVNAVASDFILTNTTTSQRVTGIAVSNSGTGVSTLTFTPGPGVISSDHEGVLPTLADGNYELRYRPNLHENVLQIGGVVFIDDFFRKYGETEAGSSAVGLPDFATFRATFGKQLGDSDYLSELDANRDGIIGLTDFAAFRQNFGT